MYYQIVEWSVYGRLCVQSRAKRESKKQKAKLAKRKHCNCLLVQSIKLHSIHIFSFELDYLVCVCLYSFILSGALILVTKKTRFFFTLHIALDISFKRFNQTIYAFACTPYMRKLFSIFAAHSMRVVKKKIEEHTHQKMKQHSKNDSVTANKTAV